MYLKTCRLFNNNSLKNLSKMMDVRCYYMIDKQTKTKKNKTKTKKNKKNKTKKL